MKKVIALGVLFLPSLSTAQIMHGTILIFNLSDDKAVIAADSRILRGNGTPRPVPDDTDCKIEAFKRKLIFTASGNGYVAQPGINVSGWRPQDVAKDSARLLPSDRLDDSVMDAIAFDWSNSIRDHWSALYRANPQVVIDTVQATGRTTLSSGVFIGADHGEFFIRIGKVFFNGPLQKDPVSVTVYGDFKDCSLSCGQKKGRICTGGSHSNFVASFCSNRKPTDPISIQTQLLGDSDDRTRLAVEIAEQAVATDLRSVEEIGIQDIGLPIEVVTLRNDGSVTWNAVKEQCR